MSQPVPCGHQTAAEKRGRASKESDHHERTSYQLDGAGDEEDPGRGTWMLDRKAEELLGTVSQEEEPDDDAHEGIRVGLETTKALHE